MQKGISKYKPFFGFILRFLGGYSFLVLLYRWYLSQYNTLQNEVDGITYTVSDWSIKILEWLGYPARMEAHETQSSMVFYFGEKAVVRMIEGCNAVSVVLLFVAFIVAFSGSFRRTFFYSVVGAGIILVLNIVRIVLITIGIYHFPQYEHILHEVIFPLMIYGVVLLLWVVWVNKYSYHAKNLT
ncbi:MAG: exosortase family protein XrtF [Flavobacteriales bacterium]|nr:exosortase family protein XrtF [Flavobacteriales bacterium]